MSLMQYLTVGRSFGGPKEGPNSYRLTQAALLPKFGRPNPCFRTTSPAQTRGTPAPVVDLVETRSLFDFQPASGADRAGSAEREPVTVVVANLPAAGLRAELFDDVPGGPVKAGPADSVDRPAGGRSKVAAGPGRAPIPGRSPFAGPSAPAVVTEPAMVPPVKKKPHWFLAGAVWWRRSRKNVREAHVQGEMALGRVTVVRNDLSDSDLEVVPASPAPAPAPARAVPDPAAEAGGSPVGWLHWLVGRGRAQS